MDPSKVLPDVREGDAVVNEIKSEIRLNRAILWLVMANLTESKHAAALFAVCAVLNLLVSICEGWEL